MKFNLLIIFLVLSVTAFSQKATIEEINDHVVAIDSNTTLKLNEYEYDWNEITGIHIDHGAKLKVWKIDDEIVKVEEQFGASYGRYTRLVYFKNKKPLKAVETEENFGFKDKEVDYSNINIVFKIQVYVTGFNAKNEEYEFEVTKEGKRIVTETYCDLNSVFVFRDEITNL